jgi:alpha-mannosidase
MANVSPTPTNIVFEQSAHCDWDWRLSNCDYYNQGIGWAGTEPVRGLLNDGISAVQKYLGANPPYVYTFCEVAYLRLFVQEDSSRIATLRSLNGNFTVSSGGFTSAENLIGHGETFIRNYLLGRNWLQQTIGLPVSSRMWIPDDFGHDAQLPIVLMAMGMTGVGFWRMPGTNLKTNPTSPIPGPNAPITIVNNNGRDFIWRAADGSTVQAHWIGINGYGEGNGDIQNYSSPVQQAITENTPAPTPWLFVPIDNDFTAPYPSSTNPPDVLQIITDWNSKNPGGVQAQLSTFDAFLTGVANSGYPLATLDANPADESFPYVPNPFWTGCYATFPALKQLHFAATRTQLFNESIELLVEYLASIDPSKWSATAQSVREAIATAWNTLMPSTHHDYITGTSTQDVHEQEQLSASSPWSVTTALNQAQAAQAALLDALAGALPGGGSFVGCFNNLGFARSGSLAAILDPSPGVISSTMDGETYLPVQYSQDGTQLMFLASAPALGYACAQFSAAQQPSPAPSLDITENADGTFTMSNDSISATIGAFGITDLRDLKADPSTNLLNGLGNQLVWYADDGDPYRFGNEMWDNDSIPNPQFAPASSQPAPQNAQIAKTEDGQLMKQVTATFSIEDPNNPANMQLFTLTYSLVAGENILRMTTTGTAPSGQNSQQGFTVMTAFPFNTEAAFLTYGTSYHWDTRAPRNYFTNWPPPSAQAITFEPTHEFVVAQDGSFDNLFAIYHFNTVAWGIAPGGVLIGALLRNTTGHGIGSYDEAQHTLSYAIRLPGGNFQSPAGGCSSNAPLGEALAFNNPILTALSPSSTGELPISMSIASTTDATSVISAAKTATANPSQWILRLYQPANAPVDMIIDLDPNIATMFQSGGNLNVAAVTALENPTDGAEFNISAGPSSFKFTAPRALATFSLTP